MKAGCTIETDRLIMRHWRVDDLEIFHQLNSDERVMKFFPFRRDRARSLEMLHKVRQSVADDGFGWAAISLKSSGNVIGFSGLAKVNFETAFTPAVEIGWRILPAHWGRGFATEAAKALVDHGFEALGLDGIVAFAVPQNNASTAVMTRIGMRPEPVLDFDMPGIADGYVHLRRHVFYRITRGDWLAMQTRQIEGR